MKYICLNNLTENSPPPGSEPALCRKSIIVRHKHILLFKGTYHKIYLFALDGEDNYHLSIRRLYSTAHYHNCIAYYFAVNYQPLLLKGVLID